MKKFTFFFAILIAAFSVQVNSAQSKEAKNQTAFINNAKLLEKKPLHPNADAARKWAFKWVSDTDDVSIELCSSTMKLIPERKNKYKAELLMQFMFGMAVFKLENPNQKVNETAAQIAGIESMLRTYEVIVKEKPKAKNKRLDELIMKRGNDELKALVGDLDCGGKKKK